MHILLVHQAFASLDEPGGTRHHELARYLADHGHRVTIITSPVSYLTGSELPQAVAAESVSDAGVRILRTRGRQSLHTSFVRRTLAFIRFMAESFFLGLKVREVNIVWGTSPPIFQGITAWLLGRWKKVPLLFEVRDLWPQFAIAIGVLKNPLLICLSQWLEKNLYTAADVVVVNSPGFVDHVRQHGARRVELVPNGADPRMFDPADDGQAFRIANRLEGNFIILYAGAHGISNDLGVVLEAAGILQRQAAGNIHFVFLGDGKEKASLVQLARGNGLENVLFLPPAPKSGMAQALAAADACLAILKPLDEYKTTYPNKVFDYMAAGRPVLLAIDGAIRQVVEAAGCGVFVPPGDAPALAKMVLRMATDPQGGRRMGLAGRRYLEAHFSREASAARLETLLQDVVNRGGRN
jgi:glycosyltransferase involved in cell wall biosynthesis